MPGHKGSERLQGISQCDRWFACLGDQSQDFCSHTGRPSLPAISSGNTNKARKSRKTNFPSDSVAKCSFTALYGKRSPGQMVRRTPRVQAALGWVLPTSAPSSATFPDCSYMDWEHSIVFCLHRSHISLKSTLWMWFSPGRWKVERLWQWVCICRGW